MVQILELKITDFWQMFLSWARFESKLQVSVERFISVNLAHKNDGETFTSGTGGYPLL